MFGVIGGTGLGNIKELVIDRHEDINTPYGRPSEALTIGKIGNKEVVFLARHGTNHSIPPHLINYQANISAFSLLGVTDIISIASVGSINPEDAPGTLVFPDQIIDYTHGRKHTFFDGDKNPVSHIDFTYPYDERLRKQFIKIASASNFLFKKNGVYGAVQGPRLETAAEINRYDSDGVTIVGMTGMPEAALARELNMNYAMICLVANHAAGRGLSANGITHDEISKNSKKMMKNVIEIIKEIS